MRDTIRKLYDLLDPRERRNGVILFGMMTLMGLVEATSVASVLPFIAVVANRTVVHDNSYLALVYDYAGFNSTDSFLLFLGGVVFVLLVASLVFKAVTHWAMARYSHMRGYTFSSRLLRLYLNRPYTFFLNRHSADLSKFVLSEVQQVTNGVLMHAVRVTASTIVAVFLIALVVLVDPVVALSAVAVLGGSYTAIFLIFRHYIGRIGAERVRANNARFQIAQEAFGGIKDVKVLGLENGYIRSFRPPSQRFARVQAHKQIVSELPQFALRALTFGGMLALLMALLYFRGGELDKVLPLVGLYAFAGTKLMPALQQVYKSSIALRFGKPALDALYGDMMEAEEGKEPIASRSDDDPSAAPIHLRSELRLDNV